MTEIDPRKPSSKRRFYPHPMTAFLFTFILAAAIAVSIELFRRGIL